jgi:hypothetical protein
MAIDSVTQTTEQTEHGPAAFSGFDSSVFSAWAAAVADLMACGGLGDADAHTVPAAGGLIFSLIKAADELAASERAEPRSKA